MKMLHAAPLAIGAIFSAGMAARSHLQLPVTDPWTIQTHDTAWFLPHPAVPLWFCTICLAYPVAIYWRDLGLSDGTTGKILVALHVVPTLALSFVISMSVHRLTMQMGPMDPNVYESSSANNHALAFATMLYAPPMLLLAQVPLAMNLVRATRRRT